MTVWAVSEEIKSISSACNFVRVIMIPLGVVFTSLQFFFSNFGDIKYKLCSCTIILDIVSLVLSIRFLSMNNNFLDLQSLTYYFQQLNTPNTTKPPKWLMDLAHPTHIMNSRTLEASTYNLLTSYLTLTSNP